MTNEQRRWMTQLNDAKSKMQWMTLSQRIIIIILCFYIHFLNINRRACVPTLLPNTISACTSQRQLTWSQKQTVFRFTLKVPFAVNAAVVLARATCQLHANPHTGRESSGTDEPHGDAIATQLHPHTLSDVKFFWYFQFSKLSVK